MKVTGPPCPCPLCGRVHANFEFTSPHSSTRGGGRASADRPMSVFRLDESTADIDSSIYGPLWKSLLPNLPCRPIPEEELRRLHTNPLSGYGQTESKYSLKKILAIGVIVAILYKML